MSDDAILTFIPWVRRGVGRALAQGADVDGVPQSGGGELEASVQVGSSSAKRVMRLRGPESVIGLSPNQVVRMTPPEGTTDFETTGFAAVELLSPELPWAFTPAAPSGDRLLPWLVLVVVEVREGVLVGPMPGARLPVLSVDDVARELPALREAWAWAHVQAQVPLVPDLGAAIDATPEGFVARLLAPRLLEPSTAYLACLVPAFEQGRRAGLGLATDPTDVSTLAWGASGPATLPVYHQWSFRTASADGDFEDLAKRLVARALDPRSGAHALDIGSPGSNRLPRQPGLTIDFVGALKAPDLRPRPWPKRHRDAYQRDLGALLEEGLSPRGGKAKPTRYDPRVDNPVVAPPTYGALAAGETQLPAPDSGRWLADANLDPAKRSAAGLGAEVVRIHQERLAAAAWDQLATLKGVNGLLNQSRLALEVGRRMKGRVDALDDGALLQLSRPAHARVRGAGMDVTVRGRLASSPLTGLTSAAFSRSVRPGSSVSRALSRSSAPSMAPTRVAAALTTRFIAEPAALGAFASYTVPHGAVLAGAEDAARPARGAAVRAVKARGRAAPRVAGAATAAGAPGPRDEAGPKAPSLARTARVVRERLNPARWLRARVRASIRAPERLWRDEDVPAAMFGAPEFPEPAYALLARIDPELILPGVGAVPTDSVALASVDDAFVEAFLLGVNEELARELVWREAPINPRDTWMRRFWDSVDGEEDIAPVADWPPRSALGAHGPGNGGAALVLLIRSELFRRYPSTLVSATPATWVPDATGGWSRVEAPEGAIDPAFVGRLGPDISFFGFELPAGLDLDRDVAGSPDQGDGKPGWFFVLEQPAAEPRFGLDAGAGKAAAPKYWKNVRRGQATGDTGASYVPLAPLAGTTLPYDRFGANTWTETWARDAAAMARITLQRPVRVLMHADRMLRGGRDG